ncbi:MAG TPA: hypothetical protein VGO47_01735 [Chlamydiales bacterium]|nr:hypothetical protein [Chlamydiales bacterium]
MGQASAIEKTATTILKGEDVFIDGGQIMNQDQKAYTLLRYGNMGVRGGIQGLLMVITAVAFPILGVTRLGGGIIIGLLGCAAMALSYYQIHKINQYLEQHPPVHVLFVT